MHRRLLLLCFVISFIPSLVSAADLRNYIQVTGEASTIVKPDIAHCFLIVSGYGADYETSSKAANEKLAQLGEVLKSVLKEAPQLHVLKVENKPKGTVFDENYQKEMYREMAKAMKGELPADVSSAQQEKATNISVYFVLTNFTKDSILKLMNSLADKEIAFNKSNMFDFATDFVFNKSAIYYGMTSSAKYLKTLAAEAFRKAEGNAKIVAAAVGKKITGLVNITGCGDMLEGAVSVPFKTNLTGKDLGPLSADSDRLMIRFSKDFGFGIK
jgi:hypothetical protein